MLRDVKTHVTDGLLGNATPTGDGISVAIGVSPSVSATPITITGSMTADKIKEWLGLSPLADAAMDTVAFGANRLYCIPVSASTAGTIGKITRKGDGGGTMTAEGSPYNAFDVIVKITAQGALNGATFVYSINGGYSYSDDTTVPLTGSYELTGTGVTLKFTEASAEDQKPSSFLTNDTYTFTTTAPVATNGDILKAAELLRNFDAEYEFVHIVGASTLPLWQAISSEQISLRDDCHKPAFFVLEATAPAAGTELDTWALALEADRKKVKNYDLQVVAAWGRLIKMDGTTQTVNLAGVACGLYTKAAVQTSIGKTRPEAGFGIPKTKLLTLLPDSLDDSTIELLDNAGFLTFRGYDGLDDYYVYHAKMLSPDGSDYRYAEDARVRNKIIREVRKIGLQQIGDDIDLEDVQGELETRAKWMFAPLQTMIDAKEISSAEITVPEGQAKTILTDETMHVKVRYVSRGYIREVDVDLGRSPVSE